MPSFSPEGSLLLPYSNLLPSVCSWREARTYLPSLAELPSAEDSPDCNIQTWYCCSRVRAKGRLFQLWKRLTIGSLTPRSVAPGVAAPKVLWKHICRKIQAALTFRPCSPDILLFPLLFLQQQNRKDVARSEATSYLISLAASASSATPCSALKSLNYFNFYVCLKTARKMRHAAA